MFHLVASTGRTATSFIAEVLNRLPGIAACHEGHQGNDDGPDLMPLINLENFQAFRDPSVGPSVVAAKRNEDVVAAALAAASREVVIDVAYYNAMLGRAILDHHPASRMVAIVRDCESFVRSVTWVTGTDPMPVGWPAPEKELSTRERFISMGRIRPTGGADLDAWQDWGSIERNIWLWRETNARILDARDRWPDRVVLLDFAAARDDILEFLRSILVGLDVLTPEVDAALAVAATLEEDRTNRRVGGYQVGARDEWTETQRVMLRDATAEINGRIDRWKK